MIQLFLNIFDFISITKISARTMNEPTIVRMSDISAVVIIPKNIEKYNHYFNYRQLTPTAIMNVLKQNFPNDYLPPANQTYALINKKSTMPDHWTADNTHCFVEVIGISLHSLTNNKYQLITPSDITMLFNCGTLYIKVDKSEKTMNRSQYTSVVIDNDIVISSNSCEPSRSCLKFNYYKSRVLVDPLELTVKKLKEWKDNRTFKIVLNNDKP